MIETDVDTITAEEEAALLKEWFATVQFDEESFGLPPMADEEDDEERSRTHAVLIREWFKDISAPVPRSLEGTYEYAHQDPNVWSFVDVGIATAAARAIIEKEASFQELFGIARD